MNHLYFVYSDRYEENSFQKLMQKPLFEQLICYFQKHLGEKIILRQLKKEIETAENLELFLDQLIKYQIVERKERQYRLLFPIFSMTDYPNIDQEIIGSISTIFNSYTPELSPYIAGEWIWPAFFSAEKDYFFAIESSIDKERVIYIKKMYKNETWLIASIGAIAPVPMDLANYFLLMDSQKQLPECFLSLEQLIGDVDFSYFIQQFQRVVRSLNTRSSKRNIFKEALLLTKDIQRNELGEEVLAIPLLKQEQFPIRHEISKILEDNLARSFFEIKDSNFRVFNKLCVFTQVINTLNLDKKAMRYIQKKKK